MRSGPLTPPATHDAPLVSDAELEHLRLITLQHRSHRRTPGTAVPGGTRPSRWRGHGMELHDVRPWQAGDDFRHIDWRATARSGKPVTKVFIEERARSLFLVIDRRPSMLFGTRRELKATTAARAAAILAFAALAERETVAGLILDDTPQWFPPTRSLQGVLRLLQAVVAAPADPDRRRDPAAADAGITDVDAILARVGGRPPRGVTCCVLSDFLDVMEERAMPEQYLPTAGLMSGQGDVVAIQVLDDAERRLPEAGVLHLRSPDGRSATVVDTTDPVLRQRYQADIARRLETLRRQCDQRNIHLISIDNHSPLLNRLEILL